MITRTTWTDKALQLWEFQWRTWGGITAQYESTTLRVIQDPTTQRWQMSVVGNDKKAGTVLDILRTEAQACGLYALVQSDPIQKRPIVVIGGARYTINKLENDDNTQPSIRVSALLVQ